ncbi:MAG: peptide chain release factor 1 [Verrucomicrobia bacterium]|nr:peptide chain release factor 1 [Verrucomicrobiota bacterium]MBU1910673.1 peptide chain release factor 1 [Verrucomicrobiota bacterium]
MIDKAHIDQWLARMAEIETALADPATAANQRRFQELLLEHSRLQEIQRAASLYFRLLRERAESDALAHQEGGDPDLAEMARTEIERLDRELPAAERALLEVVLPADPADSRNTIVEIRAGTGGEEAALFAGDLYRMYSKYAERCGWKTGLMDASPSSLGGYKEIIFSVEGRNVYRTLRYESGGHRVQRIPATEASGRIHTSAATVAVLPEAEEVDVEIKPEELKVEYCRASGPGGQSVNKSDSAVRIVHLPTGTVVQCQDERSQQRNREKAMRVLRARILDKMRLEEQARLSNERKLQMGSGDRSERIRTYNFPQNRVTDHRINLTLYTLDRVMEGGLESLVEALRERDIGLRIQQLMKT